MASAEALVSGWEILAVEVRSPLIIGVVVVVVVVALLRRRGVGLVAWRLGAGSERVLRRAATLLAVVAVLLPAAALLSIVDPTWHYGVVVEDDGTLRVWFMQRREVALGACEVESARLVSVDEARGMLKLRLAGISDPATGLAMGLFQAGDGREAGVVILPGAGSALVVEYKDGLIVVAVPGVEEAYKALEEARAVCG